MKRVVLEIDGLKKLEFNIDNNNLSLDEGFGTEYNSTYIVSEPSVFTDCGAEYVVYFDGIAYDNGTEVPQGFAADVGTTAASTFYGVYDESTFRFDPITRVSGGANESINGNGYTDKNVFDDDPIICYEFHTTKKNGKCLFISKGNDGYTHHDVNK